MLKLNGNRSLQRHKCLVPLELLQVEKIPYLSVTSRTKKWSDKIFDLNYTLRQIKKKKSNKSLETNYVRNYNNLDSKVILDRRSQPVLSSAIVALKTLFNPILSRFNCSLPMLKKECTYDLLSFEQRISMYQFLILRFIANSNKKMWNILAIAGSQTLLN